MLIAIPLLGQRVAPRCIFADSILIASLKWGRINVRGEIRLYGHTNMEFLSVLAEHDVETLICSGIGKSTREALNLRNVAIIENVTGTAEELLKALPLEKVKSGFGFEASTFSPVQNIEPDPKLDKSSLGIQTLEKLEEIDCLNCQDRACLRGENCIQSEAYKTVKPTDEVREMLESTMDVAFEEERKLCRIAELVYYCLGMKYKRIGVAFCIDLLQPATILASVLKRFFTVFPVCCKIGGVDSEIDQSGSSYSSNRHRSNHIACNPLMQAEVLNKLGTDMNVIVGLCVGADSIFTSASEAPVTTIFVKDKSLANNPIGAIYSDYYLNEI